MTKVPAGASVPLPTRRSAWSTRDKVVRVLWGTIGRLIWIVVPASRSQVLRWFGARVGRGCRFARRVEVTIPWKLRVGDDVEVGEGVILYSLGEIAIGSGSVLDYGAHLCAGSHDMSDPRFPLVTPPIRLGAGCFVGIDAYIGPGVELGDACCVWPRSSVHRSAPAGSHLRGNPARDVEPEREA